MKLLLKSLPLIALLFIFSNCVNGKKLQEEPNLSFDSAYYTTWTGGVKGAGSGINLFIPVGENVDIQLDSVYFRGRKIALVKEDLQQGLYVARFTTSREREERELVMHSDPKKEYGNPAPVILEKIPYELEADEAVVVYSKAGETKHFRISGIRKEDSTKVKIKKPENIQH